MSGHSRQVERDAVLRLFASQREKVIRIDSSETSGEMAIDGIMIILTDGGWVAVRTGAEMARFGVKANNVRKTVKATAIDAAKRIGKATQKATEKVKKTLDDASEKRVPNPNG